MHLEGYAYIDHQNPVQLTVTETRIPVQSFAAQMLVKIATINLVTYINGKEMMVQYQVADAWFTVSGQTATMQIVEQPSSLPSSPSELTQ